MSPRAAPSNYSYQNLFTKTSSPTRGQAAAADIHPPGQGQEPASELHGAASVAFEALTGPECPKAVRFVSAFDRSQVRRCVGSLADQSWPVVEIVRYAIGRALEPGVRNPRAVVISTLREPDMHAVYEHAARLKEVEAQRQAAVARQASEAARAERSAEQAQAHERRVDAVIESASATQIEQALDGILANTTGFLASHARRYPRDQLITKPSFRVLIAQALDPSIHAGEPLAITERSHHGEV